MASEKRCLYEVLGLSKDCSLDEIRSAYKKLALQRHPDKLVQSGLTHEQATAQFQELAHAYEVLSDPKERAWYDSHRSQILFSDLNSSSNSGPNSIVPNLFCYFSNTAFSGYSDSGKGFYKVYSDLFDKILRNEINFAKKLDLGLDTVREAPIMGNLESPYNQVTAFYNYWLGFSTVMDFCWVDQYDVMAGPNRKSRRVMEEENKKLRKKAKREYNETVRGLAEFVKKRHKRVIDMVVKKNEEREKKREEEREKKKKLEKERMERASRYEEPEWARISDEVENDVGFEEEVEEENEKKRNEFYCVVCGKKFKSEKQWKNHEQSKKHKEKVAELRESFVDEDDEIDGFQDLDGEMEELGDRFKEGLGVEEREVENGVGGLSGDEIEENEFFDVEDSDELNGITEGFHDADDDENEDEELSMLKAMVSGHKTRKKVDLKQDDEISEPQVHIQNVIDEDEVMEYDNQKSTRRKNKKERGRKNTGEATKGDKNGTKGENEEANAHDSSHMGEEFTSLPYVENVSNGTGDDQSGTNLGMSNQPVDGNGTTKDKKAKSKNLSRGKKPKAASKNSGNSCEKCGEEFESRNKLHKHLNDTGHASLKFR
ncbi:DNAJ protein JJJ1 homolog [Mangifera indica]|uniref:DNAJ protein JJJ1 homolog n=1 Tax=Mangifera indica TaxID=29780 RepID=UPI001CFB07E6|nr:DNAJ protein JJJ1 homolog [Mangifera indica]